MLTVSNSSVVSKLEREKSKSFECFGNFIQFLQIEVIKLELDCLRRWTKMASLAPSGLRSALAECGLTLTNSEQESHCLKGQPRAMVKALERSIQTDLSKSKAAKIIEDLQAWLNDDAKAFCAALEPLRQVETGAATSQSSFDSRGRLLRDSLLHLLTRVPSLQRNISKWLLERAVLLADPDDDNGEGSPWPNTYAILAPLCWLDRVIDPAALAESVSEALEYAITTEFKIDLVSEAHSKLVTKAECYPSR